MTEEQAIELAQNPQDIKSASEVNEVLMYLGEYINILVAEEWELRLIASQEKVRLLNTKDKTNAVAKADFEVSQEYIKWQEKQQQLRKFRAYKSDLKDKFLVLSNKKF